MSDIILDTSVLIDHLRGYQPASVFLNTLFSSGRVVYVSILSEMELFAGKGMEKAGTEEAVKRLLDLFVILPLNSMIARQAGILLRQYRHQGLTPIDALIASTALLNKTTLVTRNVKHFRMVAGLLVFDLPSC